MTSLLAALLHDEVPFFTTPSSGLYESLYVEIPGTGTVVEVLGDFVPARSPVLPENHLRLSSTDQFCTPKRRRLSNDGFSLGVSYRAGDADINKTTMASADPDAGIDFAMRYLGAARIQQGRGPQADGQCAKLAWAQWPDGHQWHLVDAKAADWVTLDKLRPNVPFNVSDLAHYVESLRDLASNQYDQWLDYRDIFETSDLATLSRVLLEDRFSFGVWSRPDEGTCSIYLNMPGNGLAVEVRSREFASSPWLLDACRRHVFDLCAGQEEVASKPSLFV
jgi:hypothetical protein